MGSRKAYIRDIWYYSMSQLPGITHLCQPRTWSEIKWIGMFIDWEIVEHRREQTQGEHVTEIPQTRVDNKYKKRIIFYRFVPR